MILTVVTPMSRHLKIAPMLAMLSLLVVSPTFAQSGNDEIDPEVRVQQLEGQLRRLTGQNEELQYRNRQLEEQLRALQGAGPATAAAPPSVSRPVVAAPVAAEPAYRAPPPGPPVAVAPIVQDQTIPPPAGGRRRGDAFDPSQNPNAPGAPRPLGGGGQPIPAEAAAPQSAPGGREAGEPLDINRRRQDSAALTTLPPSQTPRDEFDLGLGYIQRRDYALAEETMRAFAQRYPSDALVPESQYWLGESFYQRQRYRDAAESFLAVTTKYDTSTKAPDALLRLGQSLAALKEKEAACAAFGEVTRKYPKASNGVKQAVDREQKRVKC
jgi:tol-pal system protein YbgF